MNVAVIPARGGSKGITNKNLQKISGLSLIAKAIKVCIESSMFSAVFLSTDSHEIAQEARKYGAHVIDRPKSLSQDNTSTDPVINHAIEEIENLGIKFKYISLVQATYPFLDVEHIKEVIGGFKKPFDCAFGASEFHGFIWQEHKSKFLLANRNFDFKFRPRRQDQKTQLLELRNHIEKNFEYVGKDFGKKVREIYYDKKSQKGIYGTTTSEEREELAEEGIDLLSIPWVDKDN